jgi:hypothetical protein
MARASLPIWPSCVPRQRNVDPRIVEYFDIDATVDASFLADSSDSRSTSLSGGIFECMFSMSTNCSNDSRLPSS